MKEKQKNKIKKEKTKSSIKKKILLSISIIFIVVILTGSFYVYSKYNKINFEKLDVEDLAVTDVFSEVSETMSKEEFDSVKTLVFFGVDSKDMNTSGMNRSDTIIVTSINPQTKSISFLSIPRDTYVDIPGRGKDKINHAYAFGKEQLAIKTINSNFDLNITEYITIDFVGLIHVINKVGGVEVDITEEEMKYINSGSMESYKITGNKYEKLTNSGKVLLSGEQALSHSRNRTIGNDFTRAERQRTVLEALLTKLFSLELNGILSVSNSILKEVKTNINIFEYTKMLTNVFSDRNTYQSNVTSAQVPSLDYSKGETINRVYYFTTDYTKAKEDFRRYIYGD